MPAFARYIGIDYSGAETPTASLKGLRIYLAEGEAPPIEVTPPPSPRKYWTRRGIAEWLVDRLAEDRATLVGIDHGFSFPLRYFELHGLMPDWPAFLDDFQHHWPTDENIYVDFVRDCTVGNGAARMGNPRWRRLTEERAVSAKSVFHFDVQGSVAKSTHAGIPGCALSASVSAVACISGLSTGGTFRPVAQRWWRSIRRYGAVTSRARNVTAISTTHIRPPRGCAAPISTGDLPRFSIRRLPRPSARWHRSKGGSSE
jgi:hypothetical protein